MFPCVRKMFRTVGALQGLRGRAEGYEKVKRVGVALTVAAALELHRGVDEEEPYSGTSAWS